MDKFCNVAGDVGISNPVVTELTVLIYATLTCDENTGATDKVPTALRIVLPEAIVSAKSSSKPLLSKLPEERVKLPVIVLLA